MSEARLPPSSDAAHSPGHELADARPLAVGLFALGIVFLIVFSLLASGLAFQVFQRTAQRADSAPSPVARAQVPPEPRLQVDPATDLKQLREHEAERLGHYGWSDREQKVVRIPIERAIELLAERGIPEPAGSTVPHPEKEHVP